ncbi:hypothetical protein EIH07_10580 [Chryseobacterium taklimakanense]|uniref:DUF6427 family protein n=1 Tax=Chryseobacterium taklimakanense TaxID=536441 RepID=UPI000F5EA284|nr:DUF6427 family protein [Chryseobacterium taklimakanense]AZI23448.1 hypothetical protein EIH07_10580 [Chryseobacterium taklimakanense]
MFKLLSKESNIFSIPVYIIFLLFVVIAFNVLDFSYLNGISAVITFCGVALAYFVFNQINLTYQTHLPLFLYTVFIFALYPGDLDIGIAVSLLTNSFLLLILTSTEEHFRKRSYVLVGAILVVNFIFLPTTWPMLIFVILHIIATSQQIPLNIFRLFLGMVLMLGAYFCLMYFMGFTTFDDRYLPVKIGRPMTDFYPVYFLFPIFGLMVYAVIDHFNHFNAKSPISRFKYTFILIFTLAQLVTIILYMGKSYEYLLLLAFPASIILSRMLRYFPKYWMKEAGLWIIIICLLVYKAGSYFQIL